MRALPPKGSRAVALFEKGYYAGQMVVLYGSNPDLQSSTGFDGSINSVIVVEGKWTFYEDTNYEGDDVPFKKGAYEQSTPLLRNDQFLSVKKN